ncbi:unnamed protein product [Eretmochelys imbricata]
MKLCSPAPHPVSAEAPSTGGRSRDAACQPGPRAPSYTVTCCLVAAPPLPASQPSPPHAVPPLPSRLSPALRDTGETEVEDRGRANIKRSHPGILV